MVENDETIELLEEKEVLRLELANKRGLGYCYWNWGLFARAQSDGNTEQEKLQGALEIFMVLRMPRERDAAAAEIKS
jgi:hypothetical protein